MAHLCVPQNQALGVCRGFVPDIQICGTHGRKDLVNATIISNAEEEMRARVGRGGGWGGEECGEGVGGIGGNVRWGSEGGSICNRETAT